MLTDSLSNFYLNHSVSNMGFVKFFKRNKISILKVSNLFCEFIEMPSYFLHLFHYLIK